MVLRIIKAKLLELSKYFPVIYLNGPRQSGKTTLSKNTFPGYKYFSLEDPDIRILAEDDPRGFLKNCGDNAILDEIQRVPEIFNYLQSHVDENSSRRFILTGSQNFLLLEKISQSLAGRTGILNLLPFNMQELKTGHYDIDLQTYENLAFKGFYPALYDREIPSDIYFFFYFSTYLERDVRQIKNIGQLSTFSRFIKLCAGRTGQMLNLSSLANDTGVSPNTVKDWISLLEASYIIFLLRPYHKNFNKRLVKMPKLYFYDTGLLSHLLDIKSPEQMSTHYSYGSVFENFIILEALKNFTHRGLKAPLFFWRDHKGKEIDLVIQTDTGEISIEIKAGKTLNDSYFKNLKYWSSLSKNTQHLSVVYGGSNEIISTKHGQLIPWNQFDNWLSKLLKSGN